MGIFEILGEITKPGPIGSVKFDDKTTETISVWRGVLAIILLGGFEYFLIWKNRDSLTVEEILIIHIVLAFYLIVSYFVNIKPDTSNMGWVPFLINHPFRYSDNINRFLYTLSALFVPGKIISHSVVYAYRKIKAGSN